MEFSQETRAGSTVFFSTVYFIADSDCPDIVLAFQYFIQQHFELFKRHGLEVFITSITLFLHHYFLFCFLLLSTPGIFHQNARAFQYIFVSVNWTSEPD